MTRGTTSLLILAFAAFSAAAEQPHLSNGRLELRPVAGGLEATVRQLVKAASGPAWIGWSVASDRERQMCCWDSWHDDPCCSGCRLEGRGNFTPSATDRADAVKLEGGREMLVFVLLRAEAGEITKLRTFSRTACSTRVARPCIGSMASVQERACAFWPALWTSRTAHALRNALPARPSPLSRSTPSQRRSTS